MYLNDKKYYGVRKGRKTGILTWGKVSSLRLRQCTGNVSHAQCRREICGAMAAVKLALDMKLPSLKIAMITKESKNGQQGIGRQINLQPACIRNSCKMQ